MSLSNTFIRKGFILNVTFAIFFLSIFYFSGCMKETLEDPLTLEERVWLSEHDGKIRLGHDPNAKPIDYLDGEGIFQGLAADYVRLIEKRLKFQFDILQIKTWDEVLKKAQNKEVDVLCAFTKNNEREQYMSFTEPYVKIPVVILTRDDFKGDLKLDTLKSLKVTFTKGWVVEDYLKQNFSHLNMLPAIDSDAALNNLITNKADAWVTALTIASIKIEGNRVTNVRIAGETDLSFDLAFASRKDWPILNSILKKGLALISENERANIFNSWIHIHQQSLFKSKTFWIIVIAILCIVCLPIIIILFWNKALKRNIDEKTKSLAYELSERKEAQEALKNSEARYRSLVENQTDLISRVKTDGTFVYVNKKYCHFVGKTEEELIGGKWQPLSVNDDLQYINDMLAKLSPSNPAVYIENRIRSADGRIHWIHFINIGLFDNDNNLVEIQSVGRDITERKKLEQSLLESKLFLDRISDLAYIADDKGKVVYVNPAAEKLTGLPMNEIVGQPFLPLFLEKDHKSLIDVYTRTLSGENLENTLTLTSGISCQFTSLPFKDSQEKIVGTFGIARDISERLVYEKALKESESSLKMAQSVAKIGSWTYDPETRKPKWSEEMFRIFGLDPQPEAPSYDDHRNIIHPEDWDRFDSAVNSAVNESVGYDIELRIILPDGELRQVNAKCTTKKNEEGTVTELIGTTQDITDRKWADKRIQEIAERLDLATRAARLGIWDWDIPNNRLTWDDGMYQLYGIKREDFPNVYEAWLNGLHPDDRKENDRISKQARDGEREYDTEFRIIWPNGSIRFIKALGQVIWDSDGIPIRMTGINYDITEKKELETRVQQSQKMEAIGTLAGGIAHDFNNILFPIVGHTEMLLEDVPADSPLRDSLNEIYTGSLRARDLVQQILAFSRQGNSELKLMKMQPIIKEALKLIRATIPTTISISQNLQPECGAVEADPTHIHQIVMNLATNAYHAMEDTGGELKVTLKEVKFGENELMPPDMAPGSYACLTIADTGTGMDKKTIDKIFDPFFTTKEKGKGTGMGLSVVHGIVKRMGGATKVNSEPGMGTEFHVYLPIVKSAYEKQELQIKEPLPEGTERILLVDDEESIVTMERQILERMGYQITSYTSSIEALEDFCSDPDKFDIVISDMAMPKLPGDKLAVELIKIRPDIPIFLCTGFSESMSEEKIESIGVKGLLLKPIIIKDLAKKIREVLDNI